jgi:hypothetical protein
MRTKTLLIAAAALAAGLVSSQAQVYSQNVVGYANIPTLSAYANYALACQFNMGASNGLNEIFTTPLPDASTVLLWDVPSQSYISYTADSGSASGWDDVNGYNLTSYPKFPVGAGFFLSPTAPVTNLFSGTVAVNVGTSNNMVLSSPYANYMLACVVPYSGTITNGTSSTGGPNLNGLPDSSTMLVWDVDSQSYISYTADSGSPSGWDDVNGYNLVSPPTISVGQGFFLSPSDVYTWTTGL